MTERYEGDHLDPAEDDVQVTKERRQRYLLSNLRELNALNEDLANRIQTTKLASSTPELGAQKAELQNRVLCEITGVGEMMNTLQNKLKTGHTEKLIKLKDPAILAKELEIKERRIWCHILQTSIPINYILCLLASFRSLEIIGCFYTQ